jgi:hypothetical protein
MRRQLILLVVPFILLPGLAVIAFTVLVGGKEQEQALRATPSEFPDFVYYSAKAEEGYRIAVEHQQLLERLPCYCGCGVMPEDPHRNLLDCFINDDGSFDSHASGCIVCDDEAIDAARWQAEGKSAAEIRALIDAKYESYGPPTSARPLDGVGGEA